jgi:hypothetical protein
MIHEYVAGETGTVPTRDVSFTSYDNGLTGYPGEVPSDAQRQANLRAAMQVRRSASV